MEEKSGIASYFGGIIRLVIFVVLLVLIAFFVVRFVQNRRANDRADQAVNTTQQADENEGEATQDSREAGDTPSSDATIDSREAETDIPTGVADRSGGQRSGSSSVDSVPETGIEANAALTAVLFGAIAFLYTKQRQSRVRL